MGRTVFTQIRKDILSFWLVLARKVLVPPLDIFEQCAIEGETRQERLTKKTTISLDSDPFGNLLFCPSIHGIGIWYWTSGHLIIKQNGISVEIKSLIVFKPQKWTRLQYSFKCKKMSTNCVCQLILLQSYLASFWNWNTSRGDKVVELYKQCKIY